MNSALVDNAYWRVLGGSVGARRSGQRYGWRGRFLCLVFVLVEVFVGVMVELSWNSSGVFGTGGGCWLACW